MTREQKIEWLKNASNEELMEQYDISLKYREKDIFNSSIFTWHYQHRSNQI